MCRKFLIVNNSRILEAIERTSIMIKKSSVLLGVIASILFLVSCLSNEEVVIVDSSLPDTIDFNFHIRPILSDRCFACHGPDENAREGNYRLDLEEDAFTMIDSLTKAFAIKPGNAQQSHLIKRIQSSDPEYMMPPPESNLVLSTREIELLRKWIDQGAQWKSHWAFTPPQQVDIEDEQYVDGAKNEIDYFIQERLKQVNLKASKQASKEKRIRRLSFDLRGIPPSIEEIDAFLEDESETAYETIVDQFLSERAYGERLAVEWMDLARYADSHGYQDDIERSMWPWRDWVIQSFNDNMSYKEFVSLQLAGDLYEEPDYEQILATGFNRNHKITQEVGVVEEEYRVNYVLDRTNTFSTAFLGLTIECAQCHDHKYDPISQKEYYSLFSFFNHVPEKGRVDYGVEVAAPFLELPEEKIKELTSYVSNLTANQNDVLEQYEEQQWTTFDPKDLDVEKSNTLDLPKGLISWFPLDFENNQGIIDVINQNSSISYNDLLTVKGVSSGAAEFVGNNYAIIADQEFTNPNTPFSVSFWVNSIDGGVSGPVLECMDRNGKAVLSISVTWEKKLGVQFNSTYPFRSDTNIRLWSRQELPANQWTLCTVTHDGSRSLAGVNFYMNGEVLEKVSTIDESGATFKTIEKIYFGGVPIQSKEDASTVLQREVNGIVAAQIDELMFFNRTLSVADIKTIQQFKPLAAIANQKTYSEIDKKRLFYHQLLHADDRYSSYVERLRGYKIREARTRDIVVKPTMVMKDMDTLRTTYVLNRGQYNQPTDEVSHGTPQSVLPFDDAYPRNRLGLSNWLFADDNPLAARVAVNRFWQMIFGKGLVATPEDFGSQGELPSHPELLDWLAVDFQESNWDIKRLIKKMVMSSTYQQSADVNAQLLELDPSNTLLARGPQSRLPAEMIRDHALAISGLLSTQVGGPSVRPYQPEGLWLEVASGNQSLRKYIQDHNQDLYRRSLYTFWKRTIPPPSMTTFDASTREQCTVKRQSTTTPMQALVLLNDPQYIESSRLIAERMLEEGGDEVESRIQFAFRLATSRRATNKELNILRELFNTEQAEFKDNPDAAYSLLKIGEYGRDENLDAIELAAYTTVANTILNLSEAIRKA